MDSCCDDKACELAKIPADQRRVLVVVLVINLVMFGVEGVYGIVARSTSLLADSLDMLGDALVYGFSLYAIGRSPRWNAGVSAMKGGIMSLFGIGVLVQAVYRFGSPGLPVAETMGWVGALALAANLTCAVLLLRHRNDDLNMRSTWLCSRNDVIVNLGVLAAAAAVALTGSKYPDLVVGVLISGLVLRSAAEILLESRAALQDSR